MSYPKAQIAAKALRTITGLQAHAVSPMQATPGLHDETHTLPFPCTACVNPGCALASRCSTRWCTN